MLGHKMFQVLRERFPGTFCTTLEDVKRAPFDAVELLQGDDVLSGVDVTDFERLKGLLRELHPAGQAGSVVFTLTMHQECALCQVAISRSRAPIRLKHDAGFLYSWHITHKTNLTPSGRDVQSLLLR